MTHPRLEDGIKLVFAKMLAEQAPTGNLPSHDTRVLAARAISLLAAADILGEEEKEIPADLTDACLHAGKLINAMYSDFDRAADSRDSIRAMLDAD
jgi:hypothetical protein